MSSPLALTSLNAIAKSIKSNPISEIQSWLVPSRIIYKRRFALQNGSVQLSAGVSGCVVVLELSRSLLPVLALSKIVPETYKSTFSSFLTTSLVYFKVLFKEILILLIKAFLFQLYSKNEVKLYLIYTSKVRFCVCVFVCHVFYYIVLSIKYLINIF